MDLMDIAIAKGMVNNSSGGSGSSSSGSGGGSGAYIVHGAREGYFDQESGTTNYLSITEKTAGEIFELACTGPVVINTTVCFFPASDGPLVTTEISMLVLSCAKGQLMPDDYPNEDFVYLAWWSVENQEIMHDFFSVDEHILLGRAPDPSEDSEHTAIA